MKLDYKVNQDGTVTLEADLLKRLKCYVMLLNKLYDLGIEETAIYQEASDSIQRALMGSQGNEAIDSFNDDSNEGEGWDA